MRNETGPYFTEGVDFIRSHRLSGRIPPALPAGYTEIPAKEVVTIDVPQTGHPNTPIPSSSERPEESFSDDFLL